jgi:hypothetical protein
VPKVWTVVIFEVIGSHRRAYARACRYHVGKADRCVGYPENLFRGPAVPSGGSTWGEDGAFAA